jgi:hypothetical protein
VALGEGGVARTARWRKMTTGDDNGGRRPIGASLRIKCLKNKLYLSTTEFPW